MYKDDISDKGTELEDINKEENHNVTKKSVSTAGFRNDPEIAGPLALRTTQSFTGAVEELRFCNNFQRLNLNCNNAVSTPRSAPDCPRGCYLRPPIQTPFRTRERDTYELHVVPPEVLHYHGYDFEPSQIAMFWKKDCRKFLWKGFKTHSADISKKRLQ